jgi:DNA-binding IclR family transcriptional regulator
VIGRPRFTVDELARRIARPVPFTLDLLLQLEHEGLAEHDEDGYWRMTDVCWERHGQALSDLRWAA